MCSLQTLSRCPSRRPGFSTIENVGFTIEVYSRILIGGHNFLSHQMFSLLNETNSTVFSLLSNSYCCFACVLSRLFIVHTSLHLLQRAVSNVQKGGLVLNDVECEPGMPVYSGDFFPKCADLSSLKYARKICGICCDHMFAINWHA